jgi:hypothetical protein
MLDTGKSSTVKKKIFSNLLYKTPLQQKKFDQRSAKKKKTKNKATILDGYCVRGNVCDSDSIATSLQGCNASTCVLPHFHIQPLLCTCAHFPVLLVPVQMFHTHADSLFLNSKVFVAAFSVNAIPTLYI